MEDLSHQNRSQIGAESDDDGLIYILKHKVHPIIKIGKTRSLSAQRARNYALNHDDPDGWSLYHEVRSKNVSAAEARIHERLAARRAAYGYNAKEVFEVATEEAMKAVYIEIEL